MLDLVIQVLGRDGQVLHETGVRDTVVQAGARATQLVWGSPSARGYQVLQGERVVASQFPFARALPPDPLRRFSN